MQFGVVYPQIECGGDPDAVRLIGDATERLGFDHLLAYDHVLGAVHADRTPPIDGAFYDEHDPFHDPFVLFAYLAGRTTTLEFVSGVLVLPQRQTALVARQSADLSLLSGGRFRMGVGVGWNHVEYHALDQPFTKRGRRIEEQIELLRTFWAGGPVTFDGEFDHVERAALVPTPAHPIPIWVGGFHPKALDRAARIADGFIYAGSPTTAADQLTETKRLLGVHGRGDVPFGAELPVRSSNGPAEVVERMRAWEAAGGTHTSVVTMGIGLDSAQAHVEYVTEVASLLELTPR